MENIPMIKNVLILDSKGNRVAVKYYLDDDWPTDADKEAFEKAVFNNTQNTNAEITMFEKYIVVHRFVQDLHYFVIGGKEEGNELQLSFVLQKFYNSLCLLLRNNIDKKVALENLDLVHSCFDEIVHYRLILETDDNVIASKVASSNGIESGSSSTGMLYVPLLKTVLILDSEGNHVAVKYYLDDEWPTEADKKAFEKNLFNKIINTNAPKQEGKIIRFENYILIYKSIEDVYFFVIGDKDEKKRDLSSLFHCFIDAVGYHLSNNVNKEEVLENVGLVHEVLDEIVNSGCPYGGSDDDDETDDNVIAGKESSNSIESGPSLSDQTSSQAFDAAHEQPSDTVYRRSS